MVSTALPATSPAAIAPISPSTSCQPIARSTMGWSRPRRDEVGQRAEVGADGCAVTSVGEEGQDAGAFMSDEV
jgi:hypothetical protein